MKYLVFTNYKKSEAGRLAGALLKGEKPSATVYVIGVEDHYALAAMLTTGEMGAKGLGAVKASADAGESTVSIVKLAGLTKYIEAIGSTDGGNTVESLTTLANARITQLEAQ